MDENALNFKILQQLIDDAVKNDRPYAHYVKKQIHLLDVSHDQFLKSAKEQGYDICNPRVGDIEVAQYTAMKQLATKIGLPTECYDEKIRQIRIRIFGEENYKIYFEK